MTPVRIPACPLRMDAICIRMRRASPFVIFCLSSLFRPRLLPLSLVPFSLILLFFPCLVDPRFSSFFLFLSRPVYPLAGPKLSQFFATHRRVTFGSMVGILKRGSQLHGTAYNVQEGKERRKIYILQVFSVTRPARYAAGNPDFE